MPEKNKKKLSIQQINRRLDPYEKKEISKHKKLAKESLSHQRLFEAVEKMIHERYELKPYGATFFGLSQIQVKLIISKVRKLDLSESNKEKIQRLTRQFYVDFQHEFHNRRIVREHLLKEKALDDLKRNFELELDKITEKYKKKYPITDLTHQLAAFQIKVMKEFNKEFFPPAILPPPFRDTRKLLDHVVKRHAPSNRPTYECYDPYLFSLAEIIKTEKDSYIPVIVQFLKSFENTVIPIFENFEINSESIRAKISKYRTRHK